MTNGLKVTIAGLDLLGQGSNGFVISPDGFDGWDDGVSMRQENTARPQAHGSFDLPVYQDARTVSITGNAFADSPRELLRLGNRLTGLLAGGQSGRIQVERYGDVQWADGRLAAQTKFTERGGQNCASFQVQIWCPDPRKFGNSQDFSVALGSQAAVFHRGNYDAAPSIRVSGLMPSGYTLTGPGGRRFVVTRSAGSGESHLIDMNTGILKVNGSVVTGGVSVADTILIPPGSSTTIGLSAPSGTGTSTVTVLDTYI